MQNFFYPPRASDAIPRSESHIYNKLGWVGQFKFNDTHIVLCFENSEISWISDRHGKKPSFDFRNFNFSKLGKKLVDINGPGHYILDGGLLHQKHSAIKNTIVIWDILMKADKHLVSTTYGERYDWLSKLKTGDSYIHTATNGGKSTNYYLGFNIGDDLFMPNNFNSWTIMWDVIESINECYEQPLIEGIVFKDLEGKLKPGFRERNNSGWLGRSRVATGRHAF